MRLSTKSLFALTLTAALSSTQAQAQVQDWCGDGIVGDSEICDVGIYTSLCAVADLFSSPVPSACSCDSECSGWSDFYHGDSSYLHFTVIDFIPSGETDTHRFVIQPGDTMWLNAFTQDSMECADADTVLELFKRTDPNSARTFVAFDDDGGDGLCSAIGITLGEGYYELEVRDYNQNGTGLEYTLNF